LALSWVFIDDESVMGNSNSSIEEKDHSAIRPQFECKNNETIVFLNVYEPKQGMKGLPGFGVYHTGVQVWGQEYTFAGGPSAVSGIVAHQPKKAPSGQGWQYKETLQIGVTSLTRPQLQMLVSEMGREYPANSYHLTDRNCNHFATAFCEKLTGRGIPSYINRAARIGSLAKGFMNLPNNTSVDATAAGAAVADDYPSSSAANLRDAIDLPRVGCLNQHSQHVVANAFATQKLDGKKCKAESFLQSDSDEQLLIFVPFLRPAALSSLALSCPVSKSSPKTIKLYVNRQNMDFDDCSGTIPPSAVLNFTEQSWGLSSQSNFESKEYKEITCPLQVSKFQNVSLLTTSSAALRSSAL